MSSHLEFSESCFDAKVKNTLMWTYVEEIYEDNFIKGREEMGTERSKMSTLFTLAKC